MPSRGVPKAREGAENSRSERPFGHGHVRVLREADNPPPKHFLHKYAVEISISRQGAPDPFGRERRAPEANSGGFEHRIVDGGGDHARRGLARPRRRDLRAG